MGRIRNPNAPQDRTAEDTGPIAKAVEPIEQNPTAEHLTAAVVAAAVAAVLAVASAGGLSAVVVVVAVLQALLIGSWLLALNPPGLRGAAVLAAGTAIAVDVVLVIRDRPSLSGVIGVYGLAFVALIGHQLLRGPVRVKVAESMAATATLLILTGALGALLLTRRVSSGADLLMASVLAVGVALIVGNLVDIALPVPRFAEGISRGLPALLIGAIAAGAAAVWRLHAVDAVGTVAAGFLGVALGLVAGLVAVGVAYLELTPKATADRLAGVYLQIAVPLALAAPVAYLLSQVVVS